MLDADLRVAIRNFWTLFFIAAAVTVPVHLIYVFRYHNVVAVRELIPQIEQFPAGRHVHLVGPRQLHHARVGLWILDAVELVLLLLAVRAARAAVAAGQRGEVPTVWRAWRDAFRRQRPSYRAGTLASIVAGALIGIAVAVLADAIVRLLVEPFGANWSFVLLGLGQGAARAAGAAFFLGTAGASTRVPSTPDVVQSGMP